MPSVPVSPLPGLSRPITASCLLGLVFAFGAAAQPSDSARRACLAEVRQEMGRFQVKAPDPKMQEAVAGFCARGDLEGALRFAVPAAAAERCSVRVRQAGESEPAPDAEVLRRAYQLCRRGETEAALALVAATPHDPPGEPAKAPRPPPPATPPNVFRFQAEPPTVRSGEPSRLLWDVYGSREVSLDGTPVPARGESVVRPSRTTRYVLQAVSEGQRVEEKLTVAVSPYPPASLGASIRDVELCRDLGNDGGDYRCVSSDGPFYRGDPVEVILRFGDISPGSHDLEYELFAGSGSPTRWTRIDHARAPFRHGEGNPAASDPGRRRDRSAVRDHRRPPPGPGAADGHQETGQLASGGPVGPSDPVVADPGRPPAGTGDPGVPRASTAFTLADQGKGPRKLVILLDGRQETRSEILYCVECPGHDEW